MPANRKGASRCGSMARRSPHVVPAWMMVPPATTSMVAWTGSKACSQTAEATMPNANPAPPAASPPRNPPSHRMASLSGASAAMIAGSAHIEQEHQADCHGGGDRERHRGCGALANGQEFDGEHAQA